MEFSHSLSLWKKWAQIIQWRFTALAQQLWSIHSHRHFLSGQSDWHVPGFIPKNWSFSMLPYPSTHESWNMIKNISQDSVGIRTTSDFENRMTLGGVNNVVMCIFSVFCLYLAQTLSQNTTCFTLNKRSNAVLLAVVLDCRQRRCSRWWSWKQRWIAGQQQWSEASTSKLKLENTASLKWQQHSK